MLDDKALAVLNTLKTDIKANKTIYQGTVKGTGKRYGFVVTKEGKEYFLAPEEMKRVFPGDQVKFTLDDPTNKRAKAELETLIHSSLSDFMGIFCLRNKAQGIEPLNTRFGYWLYTELKNTHSVTNNDIVLAKVTQHPWDTGISRAEITRVFGHNENNNAWYQAIFHEETILPKFSNEEVQEAEQLSTTMPDTLEGYDTLTHIPFVTIDSENSKDLDDALFAEKTNTGWDVYTAISDVSAFIQPNSILDNCARQRISTLYVPGLTLPMLPEILSNQQLSLQENKNRFVLLFKLSINHQGIVTEFHISKAIIKSHGKLSYQQVDQWIRTHSTPDTPFKSSLNALQEISALLSDLRAKKTHIFKNRPDFRIEVDSEFNVIDIHTEKKTSAHTLVEELMLLTNQQVSQWLSGHEALFMSHKGFKSDKKTDVTKLIKKYLPQFDSLEFTEYPQHFHDILHEASKTTEPPLLPILLRKLERTQLETHATPHIPLGFPQYSTATSPIRKYTDLIIHRCIKEKLTQKSLSHYPDCKTIAKEITKGNVNLKNAINKIETRLRLSWIKHQKPTIWEGQISHINAHNIFVQLKSNGISGSVDVKKIKAKINYTPAEMNMSINDHHYYLEQPVWVSIVSIDDSQVFFKLIDKSELPSTSSSD